MYFILVISYYLVTVQMRKFSQQKKNVKIMKNTGNSETNNNSEDELLPEYNFDYTKARSNRFVIAKKLIKENLKSSR